LARYDERWLTKSFSNFRDVLEITVLRQTDLARFSAAEKSEKKTSTSPHCKVEGKTSKNRNTKMTPRKKRKFEKAGR
jgi:hypothetical protein